MNRLKSWHRQIVSKDLIYKLNSKNVFQIDRLNKIVLTCITNKAVEDSKNVAFVLVLLELLSSQKPRVVRAKKSVAAFKLRKFIPLGGKVTLRGKKMYNWLNILIFIIQPKLPEIIFLKLNLKEKALVLNVGMTNILTFPQFVNENNHFIKDLGLTLTIESVKKQKLSTI